MKKRIFEIIEKAESHDILSAIYDYFMMLMIIVSLIPLAFKAETTLFAVIDKVTVAVFIVDYVLRWFTADLKYGKRSGWSYVRYPFSFMAIVDLVSILPSLTVVNDGLKVLRVARLLRAMRVFRVFKAIRYSKSFRIIGNVMKASRESLVAVLVLALGYILISALIIFNVEPDSFNSFFDAVYWATVSLTTVGYGDIYPVSKLGRLITMFSSIFGIAVVALPAGIITAGYMSEIQKETEGAETEKKSEEEDKD